VCFFLAAPAVQVSLTGFAEIKTSIRRAAAMEAPPGMIPKSGNRFSDKIMPGKEKRPRR
jgi:hypothetical protein